MSRWHCEIVASSPSGTNDLFIAVEVIAADRERAFQAGKAEMLKTHPSATYIAAHCIGEI